VVVCFEVIEHVRDPEILLAEIVRVLKPGGRTFLSMPFLYPVHDAPFDFQRFTIHGWIRSLEVSGLQLIGIRPQGHALGVAAMLGCLAIAGGVARQKLFPMLVLGLIAMPFILVINLLGALSAVCWPGWEAMAQGYDVEANKP
jgi:SAM-dependent methyltransferase